MLKKFFHLFPVIALVSWFAHAEARPDAPCLKYEPDEVQLAGVMKRQAFAGAPNYESVKRGDAPEVYWILHLEKPICVEVASPRDKVNEPKAGIREVQIMIHDYRRYRVLLGKRVKISGTLSSAITGHHHTEVLIDAKDIRLAR